MIYPLQVGESFDTRFKKKTRILQNIVDRLGKKKWVLGMAQDVADRKAQKCGVVIIVKAHDQIKGRKC